MKASILKEEFTTAYSSKFILRIFARTQKERQSNIFRSIKEIMRLKTEKGLALQDVIFEVYKDVVKYKLSKKARVYLLEKLAEIEYRLTTGASEKIQVTAMLGAFKTMLDLTGGNVDEVMADTDTGGCCFGNIPLSLHADSMFWMQRYYKEPQALLSRCLVTVMESPFTSMAELPTSPSR
ncbi:4628_t:CDS:2 [Paraglomus occultum]|uniref:4628_t:CDS:1 n=1 Tax=Paraglomus occultum TaxID=144539 RepID=A0A9N9BYA3_9GLOM|nr:4628_t:CDS:2 [Paraglomus occultum]